MSYVNKLSTLAAALLCACAQGVHADDVFHGHCDGSAGVYLGQGQFVIADDDSPDLFIVDRTTKASRLVALAKDLDSFKKKKGEPPKPKEPDTEGAAMVGDRIYWISSHGLKRDKDDGGFEDDPYRLRFFATTVLKPTKQQKNMGLQVVKPYRDDLKASLLKVPTFKVLADTAGKGPEEPHGFNIEGLAAGPDGSLLIGFRNPLSAAGHALLAPLQNPAKVIDKGKPFQWGSLIELDLQGRGIRSIEKVGKQWLIIAGPTGDPTASTPSPRFALFSWAGPGGSKPVFVQGFDDPRFHPEAMFEDTDRKELVLLSDDGDEPDPGHRCKKLKNPADKSFKVRYLKLPLSQR
ncbi:DUF3616 domain-containing protein [Aquabacterium sp.]|uniref:DUF3616 domain-containing protein n=1 Tax=Aquabacterium sp. TaxID=1872578 RepID=UPI004037E9FE